MTETDPVNKDIRFLADCAVKNILKSAVDLARMTSGEFHKTCITCDKFNEKEEVCMKFKMKPPARVIAFACAEYDNINDDIPF